MTDKLSERAAGLAHMAGAGYRARWAATILAENDVCELVNDHSTDTSDRPTAHL